MMEQIQGATAYFENVSTTVTLNGRQVKIHGLSTGSVAVKKNFKSRKGSGVLSKLNILLDDEFTAFMPIWVWVIEHPDGMVVIDTGERSPVQDLDSYLEKESWFQRFQFKHAAKFLVPVEQELNHQMQSVGLSADDVDLVILTHLHLDHTDGLKFFPKQEVIVGNHEFLQAKNNMPSTYPSWFKPNRVEYLKNRVEVFDQAYPLNRSGDLLYLPTPGHTGGHSSVLFKTDEFDIFFAGDASYDQAQVLNGIYAGVNASFRQTVETYRNILEYGRHRATIYLPSHDRDAGHRLVHRSFLGSPYPY